MPEVRCFAGVLTYRKQNLNYLKVFSDQSLTGNKEEFDAQPL